jgi:ribonuclease HI
MKGYMTFDGGSRGNPGPAAAGAVVVLEDGTVKLRHKYIGRTTNNVAEYKALIVGCNLALDHKVTDIEIKGDANLIVNHVNGLWICKAPNLKIVLRQATAILTHFESWTLSHHHRSYNREADLLVNLCLDQRASFIDKRAY